MNAPALSTVGDGRYALSGDLVFASAPLLLEAGEARFGGRPQAEVDLAGVGRVDSAGLALLLEWLLAAQGAGRTIRYRNMPAVLESLAGISGVSELLESAGA